MTTIIIIQATQINFYRYFNMKVKIYQIVLLCFCIIGFGSYSQDCPDSCKYYIPNVLTPDCDGVDCEILEIRSSCSFNLFDFTLFNRWGEIIFHSTDVNKKFDCTGYKDGTYIWKLKGEFCSGQIIDDTGHLNIFR